MRPPVRTRLLVLPFCALYAAALSSPPIGVQEPRVLDGAMHHLGDGSMPEWSEAAREAEGKSLALTFSSRAIVGEATLQVRQRDIDDAWHIAINGTRVATLDREKDLTVRYYRVPAGVLRDGENAFELTGDVPTDDITFGEVRLHERALRKVLDLRRVTVRVRTLTGEPSPARVTICGADGELAPLYYAERLHTAVREGLCYTSDGEACFELPPGVYEIHATRGPEWSLARAPLALSSAEERIELVLAREVDTRGFVAADTHVHTLTFSGHGDSSVEERMVTLAGEGVELAVATDHNHNTDYRPYQERMGLAPFFTPVVGNEVTTPIGHFNGFPLDPADEVPPYDLRDVVAIVDGIRARGAKVVTLNHPRWPDHEEGPFGIASLDHYTGASGMLHPYDAMELINSQTKEDEPMLLFHDWFALLNRGERVCAVASSDSHAVGEVVGMGRTYVRSSTDDPARIDVDECCANLVAGRSSIGMGIFADVSVDRRSGMGDLVAVGSDGSIDLSLSVRSASWIRPERAMVYANGTLLAEREVQAAADPAPAAEPGRLAADDPGLAEAASRATDVRLDFPRLAVPVHDAWVVCVVTGPGVGGRFWPQVNDYTLAATNPVFLDGDGDGTYTPPRETARGLLTRAGTSPETVRTLLATCEEAVALHLLDLAREDYQRQALERLRAAAREAAAHSERVRDYLGTLLSKQ